jgi:cob(I)alamin adenosyltransferase
VCRRAEREVISLARQESLNPNVVIYLNRLSDLLFVLARVADRKEHAEELWNPGKNQDK